jgi:hypothetical protein
MYTRPIISLSFTEEPGWSRVLGDLYCGLPLLLSPFLWWATGSAKVGLLTFFVVGVFSLYALGKILLVTYRLIAWLVTPKPKVIWIR